VSSATASSSRAEPVFVDELARTEILDAGAAPLEQARGDARAGGVDRAEQRRGELAHALERGAVVGRAERDHATHEPGPAEPLDVGVVARAADHEPAHAVPHQHELVELDRPRRDERRERARQEPPVLGDVAPRVVASPERADAEISREQRAEARARIAVVGLRLEPPRPLGGHEPVHEHDDPRARLAEQGDERGARVVAVERQGARVDGPQLEAQVEPVLARVQRVTDGAVQEAERGVGEPGARAHHVGAQRHGRLLLGHVAARPRSLGREIEARVGERLDRAVDEADGAEHRARRDPPEPVDQLGRALELGHHREHTLDGARGRLVPLVDELGRLVDGVVHERLDPSEPLHPREHSAARPPRPR
jgi:hypothetical protein